MDKITKLKGEFITPTKEFSMKPFWFLNGHLNKSEILDKIADFKNKGIDGFVIHPRMGLPKDIEYLSEKYMDFIKFIVQKAKEMDMEVILYDEGMYPSGSANGKVVEGNPEYAARGLRMEEHKYNGISKISANIKENEKIVLSAAVKKTSDTSLDFRTVIKLKEVNGEVTFIPKDSDNWSVIFLISTFSKGTIRGIHFGEDDGEVNAPKAADLLNENAVKKFIKVTHEAYYSALKEYFGNTVKAMFTDEPNVLGRCVDERKIKPWTIGFLQWYESLENKDVDLLSLWFNVGSSTESMKNKFKNAVNKRLERTYYSQLSKWCRGHNIALTGHPAASSDIGFLKYFQIPGQDLVWRWVGPEDNKAIEGEDSTMAKCSSDAARHYGMRKNANECFGCCGPDGHQWEFSVDDMKWFMDWLFVRGVNTLYPHAFLYSTEGEKRLNERPPDVGPNNLWWKYYNHISNYAKRMGWLLTDSVNATPVAVLCTEHSLPWRIVKPLYENQIEFNYLEENLLLNKCTFNNEFINIEKQQYSILIIEDIGILNSKLSEKLNSFIENGGCIIIYNPHKSNCEIKNAVEIDKYEYVIGELNKKLKKDIILGEYNHDLRVSHVIKGGTDFYILVNEGEEKIESEISIKNHGYFEAWNPWSGNIDGLKLKRVDGDYSKFNLQIQRREAVVICVNKEKEPAIDNNVVSKPIVKTIVINNYWHLTKSPKEKIIIKQLKSWDEFQGMKYFSGEIKYETYIPAQEILNLKRVQLDLGDVFEIAELYIDDKLVGVKMWRPYIFDITEFLTSKKFKLTIKVTNSIARRISKSQGKSGMLGPVKLRLFY